MNLLEKAHVFEKMAKQRLRRVEAQAAGAAALTPRVKQLLESVLNSVSAVGNQVPGVNQYQNALMDALNSENVDAAQLGSTIDSVVAAFTKSLGANDPRTMSAVELKQSISPAGKGGDFGSLDPNSPENKTESTGTVKQQNQPDAAREKQITENIINQSKTILSDLADANMQSLTDAQKQQAETFMKKLYPALVWRRKWLAKGPLSSTDVTSLMEEINELIGPNNKGFYNVTQGYKNMGSGGTGTGTGPAKPSPTPGPASEPSGVASQQKSGTLNVKKKQL